ncbi:MAG: carboxyl transferase domain-containing protein, partial [Acutalibacteraceae bacterium]
MKANDLKSSGDFTKESTAGKRISVLTGGGIFTEIGKYVTDNERAAQVVTGSAEICGMPCMVFSQNPDIESGAMSEAHCKKIRKIYELAEKTGVPVVGIYDSNGARVSDGITALDSYSELLRLSNRLSGVVPQIAVIAGTCAGSAAMLAMTADIVIMLEKAQFFLASPFNSDKTDGSAETAAKNGCVHIVVKDIDEAAKKVRDILSVFPVNNIAEPLYTPPVLPKENPECAVCSCIDEDSGIEVMEDFGRDVYTAFARIDGTPAGIVSADPKNGKIDSDSSVKAANFVRLCDAFSIPVITFVNAEGFEDEGGKELRSAARLA